MGDKAEKVTSMILKVDLQCPSCYKKVKKILCKFPQIRDQIYDEKDNLVKITVVCCSPEKIRDKLCCKGCKVIKSIEIVEPPKPKPPPPKPKAPPPKPSPPEKPKDEPKDPIKPDPVKPRDPEIQPPQLARYDYYGSYGGGPCYYGYGRPLPPPPPPCYDYYGSYGKGCYVSRCDYFSEENASACTIM